MHDLIFALAFVAMILTPCIVAAVGGKESSEVSVPSKKIQIASTPAPVVTIEQPTHAKAATRLRTVKVWKAQTLPMRHSLGMANR